MHGSLCSLTVRLFLLTFLVSSSAFAREHASLETAQMLAQFQRYSGARLVFTSDELPRGRYHDIMLPLSAQRKHDAAAICLREVKKYPPGYLGEMGLKAIGVFAACASREGDGFREFDREIGGYRYYGIWNGTGGIAAAYYTDGQLPLTFHHEIFHHIDGTHDGVCDASRYFASDDAQFASVVDGRRRYGALEIRENDLNKLSRLTNGYVLKDAVSSYSAKAHGEDQAETARYFMTNLPDALVQMAERPDLPGSQRMLHCLTQYAGAVNPDRTKNEADVQWFVDVALGRQASLIAAREERSESGIAKAAAEIAPPTTPEAILQQLQAFSLAGETGWDGVANRETEARRALGEAATADWKLASPKQRDKLVADAAEVTHRLLRYRLRALGDNDERYAIWGGEDADGVNWTLRGDLATFGKDALRLRQIADQSPESVPAVTNIQLQNLRLVARYYDYIDRNWSVTGGTKFAFESTRDAFADSLPAAQSALAAEIRKTDLGQLARRIPVDGTPKLLERVPDKPRPLPRAWRENNFLVNVDRAVRDPDTRSAIRRVQPACVRFANGSGCCVSPQGVILTAAHVVGKLGRKMPLLFPDGTSYVAQCTAISEHLDLAVLKIEGVKNLPYAPISPDNPEAGTWVCAIGQPGSHTPTGEETGYGAFHVSTGHIRGFKGERLGVQSLGGVKHDAWTYWGHSGCPLFNSRGEIVAMHNSWDSTTAMRHGVTYEAIVYFLGKAKVDFAMSK